MGTQQQNQAILPRIGDITGGGGDFITSHQSHNVLIRVEHLVWKSNTLGPAVPASGLERHPLCLSVLFFSFLPFKLETQVGETLLQRSQSKLSENSAAVLS